MAVSSSVQPSLDNSPTYWNARRCQDYLLDNGVWVGNWPADCETSLDCVGTIRAACAHVQHGCPTDAVMRFITQNCELSAELV